MSDPCKFVGVEGTQCDKLHQVLDANPCMRKGGKRAPSAYNLYIKACLKAKGGVKKFGEAGPKMRVCAGEYKEDKRTGKTRYQVEVPQSPIGSQPTLWKGRDLQKEWAEMYANISGSRRK